MDYTVTHFLDKQNSMFYFTSKTSTNLIARKMEIQDNAIPSSNSILAHNLFQLGHYYSNAAYSKIAKQMLNNVKDDCYGITYRLLQLVEFNAKLHWGIIMKLPFLEKMHCKNKRIASLLFTQHIIAGATKESTYSNHWKIDICQMKLTFMFVWKAPAKCLKRKSLLL